MAVETVTGLPADQEHDWRVERLMADAGFDAGDADLLAATPGVDYRLAVAMVADGCPHATVLFILT